MKALAFFILYPIGIILLVWIHPALIAIIILVAAFHKGVEAKSQEAELKRRYYEALPDDQS